MRNARNHVRWAIAYWISRSLSTLGGLVPTFVWYALSVPVAEVCWRVMWPQRRRLIENLRRVVGDDSARSTARRVFHNWARYVIDFYELPLLGHDTIERRFRYPEWPRLHSALSEGKGTVFVTIHLGQHEMGAATVSNNGHRVNVIAEKFNYPPMDDFIQGLRLKLGMTVIPANRAIPGILRCLKRGEVLAMLFDAVRPGEGMKVQFFGDEAEMSSAPARIAVRTGSRVLTTVVTRDPKDPKKLIPYVDFDVRFEPTGDEETDVRNLTQAMATSFESFVRRFPEQWFAFRPVWTKPLPPLGQSGKVAIATAIGQSAPAASDTRHQTPDTRSPSAQAAGSTDNWKLETENSPEVWRLQALKAASVAGRVLPKSVAYAMARVAGDAAYKYREGARADVEDNMRHVLGPAASPALVRRHAREAFRNVARYYVDLIRLPHEPRISIDRNVRMHDFGRLTSILNSGRGAIVATAHYGNPEIAVQVGSLVGLDILVLAEPLEPPEFSKLMTEIRSTFGPTYVDVGFSAIAQSLRHLRAGGCLAIAADRDVQENGVPMPFFGEPTRIPIGAVELAARTGAAIIPGFVRRDGSGFGFDVYFEPELALQKTGDSRQDAIENTRRLLARMEAWISADPGQWFVLERFWKKPLDVKPLPSEQRGAPSPISEKGNEPEGIEPAAVDAPPTTAPSDADPASKEPEAAVGS